MRCPRCKTENKDDSNNCIKCNLPFKRPCQRCRTLNGIQQVYCGNCGLKLINVCPKCKYLNSPSQKYCGHCGFKIINFCPKCGMNNLPGQRFCGNCATSLIPPNNTSKVQQPTPQKPNQLQQQNITDNNSVQKVSPPPLQPRGVIPNQQIKLPDESTKQDIQHIKLKEVLTPIKPNFDQQPQNHETLQNKVTEEKDTLESFEDNDNFTTIPSIVSKTTGEKENLKPEPVVTLTTFPVLSIEISNISTLAQTLEKNTLNALLKQFWDINKTLSLKSGAELLDLTESVVFISFNKYPTLKEASYSAIKFSEEIFKLVNMLNLQIKVALNTEIKIKIGLALNSTEGSSQLERLRAKVGSLIVCEEIKNETENTYKYLTIGPLPVGNKMITYYQYTFELDTANIEEIQAKDEHENKIQQNEQSDRLHLSIEVKESKKQFEVKSKNISREEIINNLINLSNLVDSSKQGALINIISESGLGKSSIIRTLRPALSPQAFLWMINICDINEKYSPLSTIKALLNNFFGIPAIIYDQQEAINIIKNAITSLMDPDEWFENILKSVILGIVNNPVSKNEIVNALSILLKAVSEKFTLIIAIDDIENADETSLEILNDLIIKGLFDSKIVLITTNNSKYNLLQSILVSGIEEPIEQMSIMPLDLEGSIGTIKSIAGHELILPNSIFDKLLNISNGNPLIIETALILMYELGVIINSPDGNVFNQEAAQWTLPDTFNEILQYRLHRLSQVNPNAFNLLVMASLLGTKFTPKTLQELSQINKDYEEHLQLLISLGYLLLESNNSIVFKNNITRNFVYQGAISDENRPQYHAFILNYFEKLIQNNVILDLCQVAIHADHSGKKRRALNYLNIEANKTLSLGLHNAYSQVMQKYLEILKTSDLPEKRELELQILEDMGKIIINTNPKLANHAFSRILSSINNTDNISKIIEVRGLNSYAFELIGKFDDASNQLQKSLDIINTQNLPHEQTLILCSQLSLMEKMGNYAWVTDTYTNKILPVFKDLLENNNNPLNLSEEEVLKLYLRSKIIYAKALTNIGHFDSINIITEIIQELQKHNLNEDILICYILKAKAHAIRGEIFDSEKILNETKEYIYETDKLLISWLEAACYYSLEAGDWDLMTSANNELRKLSNKLKDYNNITLSSLCDGLLELTRGNKVASLENFNNLLVLASEHKIVTFALMAWYYTAADEINCKNYNKAEEIIKKALEIAKKPNINNLNSIISLNRLLGEMYIKKLSFQNAGDPLEEAWKISVNLKNNTQTAKVSTTIAQLYQELLRHLPDNKAENAQKSNEYYLNALNIYKKLNNNYHNKRIGKLYENFQTICSVNSINLN